MDEYQVAGVFVNWWTNIKYDLKTIATIGWVPSLVPREYFIETYFKAEAEALQQAENQISELEAALQEAIETEEYEPEESEEGSEETAETIATPKLIKDYLTAQIKLLAGQEGADEEVEKLKKTLEGIKEKETAVKEAKGIVKELYADLDKKIEFKMYGVDEEKEELNNLLTHTLKRLSDLMTQGEPEGKKEKTAYNKTLKALNADSIKMQEKLNGLDAFLESIGGVITAAECKTLILQKHNNLVQQELLKYLNSEKRKMIASIEKLWDKYAVSSTALEGKRSDILNELNTFLNELNYLN